MMDAETEGPRPKAIRGNGRAMTRAVAGWGVCRPQPALADHQRNTDPLVEPLTPEGVAAIHDWCDAHSRGESGSSSSMRDGRGVLARRGCRIQGTPMSRMERAFGRGDGVARTTAEFNDHPANPDRAIRIGGPQRLPFRAMSPPPPRLNWTWGLASKNGRGRGRPCASFLKLSQQFQLHPTSLVAYRGEPGGDPCTPRCAISRRALRQLTLTRQRWPHKPNSLRPPERVEDGKLENGPHRGRAVEGRNSRPPAECTPTSNSTSSAETRTGR